VTRRESYARLISPVEWRTRVRVLSQSGHQRCGRCTRSIKMTPGLCGAKATVGPDRARTAAPTNMTTHGADPTYVGTTHTSWLHRWGRSRAPLVGVVRVVDRPNFYLHAASTCTVVIRCRCAVLRRRSGPLTCPTSGYSRTRRSFGKRERSLVTSPSIFNCFM
jgi:hypothetical protein